MVEPFSKLNMEYLVYGLVALLGYVFGWKKKTLENKKLEMEILNMGSEVWASIKDDLMEQIKNLKGEVSDLRNENIQLRTEIVNLQNIINLHNN